MENKMMVMRVALRDVSRVVEEMTRGTMTKEPVDRKMVDAWAMWLCEIISRDLAIPLRNCDVGTPQEQYNRFREFCLQHTFCEQCQLRQLKPEYDICGMRCGFKWAQMPYEQDAEKEGDAK